MESNYEEFKDYYIINDTIIIKPEFNDNINLIIFVDNIISLVFTNYKGIVDVKKSLYNDKNINYNKYYCSKFNQNVDNLPQSLLNLIFGCCFNQSVDNLPQSLLNLSFGPNFNQLINDLPNSLITLNFICNLQFNKELNCLPNTIQEIKLPSNYNQEIKNIPSSLKKIICSSSYKYKFIDNFNDNILIEKY